MMAIIMRRHGDTAIGTSERHSWREAGRERRRPTERADTVSVKHKGDSWRWGWSKGKIRAEGRQGQKEKDSETPSFVCRIVCLLIPFFCHLTLPSSPLLAVSDLSLSSSLLWPCPLLIPHSLPFVWQASTLEIITPPPSLRLIPFLGYLLHLQTYLHLFPSISPASHAFSLLLSMWLLWKQVYLEIAGGK